MKIDLISFNLWYIFLWGFNGGCIGHVEKPGETEFMD